MLRIITGKPGAGKSYYVVHQITQRHCDYDHIACQYILQPGVYLAASLDGLRVDHVDIDQLIKQHGLETVINIDYWQPISERYPKIVIVIDEAQRHFPSNNRSIPNSVWYFFEYHRHLGLDLYLLTQHPSSLHRRILNVAEQYIEAAPPSLRGVGNVFRYRNVDVTTGEVIARSTLKADPRVFRAYQSATHAQGLKPPKNALMRYLVYAGLCFFALPIGVYSFSRIFAGSPPAHSRSPSSPSVASIPHDVPPPPSFPTASTVPSVSPVTAVDLKRWAVTGVPLSDLDRLPPGCTVQGPYVHCPPFTLPRDAQFAGASYVCDPSHTRCHVYIPINSSPSPRAARQRERGEGEGGISF